MPLITFEGIEGCGKSTQARLAARWLESRGTRARPEREPGGTPIGARLREILLDGASRAMDPVAELLLMAADRRQHVIETLNPALARGEIVLCDRFSDATLAYQGGGRGLDPAMVAAADRWATEGLRPDLTLVFDCPVATGIARAIKRDGAAGARFEGEPEAFHERVRQAYLEIARREPERVKVIDATGGPDEVFEEVRRQLERLAALTAR